MRSELRALFITTATTEPIENVAAWAHAMGPAEHIRFDINGPPKDEEILARAGSWNPDVIFYTGGIGGVGLPSDDTLRALRKFATSVILQGDMGDPPFHPVLKKYREDKCFDFQVGMDGVKSAPVDFVTLTPFDLDKFDFLPSVERDIPCGFAGNFVALPRYNHVMEMHGTYDIRSKILHSIGDDVLQLRVREYTGSYEVYIGWLNRCCLSINTSWAGSGLVHHVKGRTLESSFAGAAILEQKGSPLGEWFPSGSFFTYNDADDARHIITKTPSKEVAKRAAKFSTHARKHYNPEKIYTDIAKRIGLL